MSSATHWDCLTSIQCLPQLPSLQWMSGISWTAVTIQTKDGVRRTSRPWRRCTWDGLLLWSWLSLRPSRTWNRWAMAARPISSAVRETATSSICWRTAGRKDGIMAVRATDSLSSMWITKRSLGQTTMWTPQTGTTITTCSMLTGRTIKTGIRITTVSQQASGPWRTGCEASTWVHRPTPTTISKRE